MIKELLKEKNFSIYKLSQISGIPYSTLNDIVNHKIDVKNIRAGILFALARTLQISMDELYELCSNKLQIFSEEYGTIGKVYVKNKTYFLKFFYGDKVYEKELYPVKREATMFIDSIATWEMEKLIADIEMEAAYELFIKKER